MKMRLLCAAVCLLLARMAFAAGPSVSITHVWIRSAPAGIVTLSGYMTLENLTAKPLQILGISSPDFSSVTISPAKNPGKPHSTLLMKTFNLPPHQPVTFTQDRFHLQLMQSKKRLFDGDMITLDFKFSDGSELTLFAPVRHNAPGT